MGFVQREVGEHSGEKEGDGEMSGEWGTEGERHETCPLVLLA